MVPQTSFEQYQTEIKDVIRNMKHRIRKLERKVEALQKQRANQKPDHEDTTYNGHTFEQLISLVECSETARKVMLALFSLAEMKQCSISGKVASRGNTQVKRDSLNREYVQTVRKVLRCKHPNMTTTEMTAKMQSVLKAARFDRL